MAPEDAPYPEEEETGVPIPSLESTLQNLLPWINASKTAPEPEE
ncbi:MAG: hypothetical protein R3C11_22980 [Planctomycetaceae bacterium]